MLDNKFEPKTIEISPSDTVTLDFKGNAQHNAKGDGGIDSDNKKEGSYSKQFSSSGTYSYFCTIHSGNDRQGRRQFVSAQPGRGLEDG